MEHADKNEWAAARKEWDGVLSDLEAGMIELKSEHLSQLVSLGGWLRGTERSVRSCSRIIPPSAPNSFGNPFCSTTWKNNFSR